MAMKRFLLLVGLVAMFSSCEKAVLKVTTVSIDTRNMEVSLSPDPASEYFYPAVEQELVDQFVQDLQDHLGKGKIDIVPSGGDYVLSIRSLGLTETVTSEEADGQTYWLSTLNVQSSYTLLNNETDLPNYFDVEGSRSETLHCPEEGGEDLISIEEVYCDVTFETRANVKKMMKEQQ